MREDLRDKVVWITGASSGIGEALAHEFAGRGSRLILSARRQNELERVRSACPGQPDRIAVLPMDITDLGAIPAAAETARQAFGRIDVLINNSGIGQRKTALETPLEFDIELFNTNYFGAVALTKAVLPHMLETGAGHITVVSSVVAYFGTPRRSAYCASKHALNGFFEALRYELAARNIKVLVVCPGYVATDFARAANRRAALDPAEVTPHARGMTPARCAARIVHAIESGREEILVGGFVERLAVYSKRFFPALFRFTVKNLQVNR